MRFISSTAPIVMILASSVCHYYTRRREAKTLTHLTLSHRNLLEQSPAAPGPSDSRVGTISLAFNVDRRHTYLNYRTRANKKKFQLLNVFS